MANPARYKNRTTVSYEDGTPVYKVEIDGDPSMPPVERVPSFTPVSGNEGGAQPGYDPGDAYADKVPVPEEEDPNEGEPDADSDDAVYAQEEADALMRARNRFAVEQGLKAPGERDISGWDDPYEEPIPEEASAEWDQYQANGYGDESGMPLDLEKHQTDTGTMLDYARQLEAQQIDPGRVQPTFLQNRFGLTRPQAVALSWQFNNQDLGE